MPGYPRDVIGGNIPNSYQPYTHKKTYSPITHPSGELSDMESLFVSPGVSHLILLIVLFME